MTPEFRNALVIARDLFLAIAAFCLAMVMAAIMVMVLWSFAVTTPVGF